MENFPDYYRRVGADFRESGNEATAEDYTDAAERVESVFAELVRLSTEIERSERMTRSLTLDEIRRIAGKLIARA